MSTIQWPLVAKLFAGGALTGAGLGAGSSVLRYLKSLEEQAQPDTSADDDVLYVNLRRKKKESPDKTRRPKSATSATFATGGLAGILGAMLAYNQVRSAYQSARRKRLQTELDDAQQLYLDTLSSESDLSKAASDFGFLSKGVGSAYLALLLAALGSGVAANQLLKKQFPAVQPGMRNRPRKIVVRSDEDAPPSEVQTNLDVTPDHLEGLVRTTLDYPKSASVDGSLADLVGAVACGRTNELRAGILDVGADGVLDLVKGARSHDPGGLRHELAVTLVCCDPLISEAMSPLIAAEFLDGGGSGYAKLASALPEADQAELLHFPELMAQQTRRAYYEPWAGFGKKMAMTDAPIEAYLLSRSLQQLLGDDSKPSREEVTPRDTNTAPGQQTSEPSVEMSGLTARDFWQRYGDTLDKAMAVT